MLTTLAITWLAAAAPETAPPAAAPSAPAIAAPAKTDDPMVCRSETPIGSKLPQRICVRKSERDRQRRESEEALQLIQRRSEGPTTIRDR